jgi:hypothetical protein
MSQSFIYDIKNIAGFLSDLELNYLMIMRKGVFYPHRNQENGTKSLLHIGYTEQDNVHYGYWITKHGLNAFSFLTNAQKYVDLNDNLNAVEMSFRIQEMFYNLIESDRYTSDEMIQCSNGDLVEMQEIFYRPIANGNGKMVEIEYYCGQERHKLSRAEAYAYLVALKSGYVGTHMDMASHLNLLRNGLLEHENINSSRPEI